MPNRDFKIEVWSRFVWTCDINSTLGSVVPLAMFLVKRCLFFKRRECTCHVRGKNFCQLAPPGEREENILVKTAENISATWHHPSPGLRQLWRRSTLLATVTQVVWSRDTESGLVWSWIVQLHPDHKLINLIKLLRGNSSEEIAARIPRQTFPKEKWGTRPCDHLFLWLFLVVLSMPSHDKSLISYYDFKLPRTVQ